MVLPCLGALDNAFVDGVSNLHPRINEVLMKERIWRFIRFIRFSISSFEIFWRCFLGLQEDMDMKVQGARKLLRLCTEAVPSRSSAVGRERRQPRGDTRWHERCQVPVLEQLAEHSTLLGAGIPVGNDFHHQNMSEDVRRCQNQRIRVFCQIYITPQTSTHHFWFEQVLRPSAFDPTQVQVKRGWHRLSRCWAESCGKTPSEAMSWQLP